MKKVLCLLSILLVGCDSVVYLDTDVIEYIQEHCVDNAGIERVDILVQGVFGRQKGTIHCVDGARYSKLPLRTGVDFDSGRE